MALPVSPGTLLSTPTIVCTWNTISIKSLKLCYFLLTKGRAINPTAPMGPGHFIWAKLKGLGTRHIPAFGWNPSKIVEKILKVSQIVVTQGIWHKQLKSTFPKLYTWLYRALVELERKKFKIFTIFSNKVPRTTAPKGPCHFLWTNFKGLENVSNTIWKIAKCNI